jgi:hypothetical protein
MSIGFDPLSIITQKRTQKLSIDEFLKYHDTSVRVHIH